MLRGGAKLANLTLSEWSRQQLLLAASDNVLAALGVRKPRNRPKEAPKHHNPLDVIPLLCARCARLGSPACPACRKGAGL